MNIPLASSDVQSFVNNLPQVAILESMMRMTSISTLVKGMTDEEEIFSTFWDDKDIHDYFIRPPEYSKTNKESENARQKGNEYYKKGHLEAALKEYDRSILSAPHPELQVCDNSNKENCGAESNSSSNLKCEPRWKKKQLKKFKPLALGYANRSAVFQSMKKYDYCLSDIDMALKYGYPPESRDKLEGRRERCLEAKAKCGKGNTKKKVFALNEMIPPKLAESNPNIPCFSSALSVAYSKEKGRHIVATRDIAPGEILFVDKNYCSQLFVDSEDTHCPVCLMECPRKIPCPTCDLVAFCSDSCRAKGLKEHKKHCKLMKVLRLLTAPKIDTQCSFAVKLLANTTFAQLKKVMPKLMKETKVLPPHRIGFDEEGMYNSLDYRAVHHAQTKPAASDNLKLAVAAFFFVKAIVHREDFFVNEDGLPFEPSRDDCVLTGAILLRQMMSHSALTPLCDTKTNASQRKIIGQGLYPALSLLRHSCNPPTVHYNVGHNKILQNIFPISQDEEVTWAFTDRYSVTPIQIRKMKMDVLGIKCSCQACTEFWPPYDEHKTELRFKCINCSEGTVYPRGKPICVKCKTNYDMNAISKYDKGVVQKKFWTMVDKVMAGHRKFGDITVKLTSEDGLTKEERDYCYEISYLVKKHVMEPSMIYTLLRDTMLVLFYRNLEK